MVRADTADRLLGLWILADVLAHASNYIGVLTWIAITPFDYGTQIYELSGVAYWAVGLSLWAMARYA